MGQKSCHTFSVMWCSLNVIIFEVIYNLTNTHDNSGDNCMLVMCMFYYFITCLFALKFNFEGATFGPIFFF